MAQLHGRPPIRIATPAWLKQQETPPMILDCQPLVNNYVAGHIPGAVHVEESVLRLSHFGRPGVLAPTEIIEQSLRHIGLKAGEPVVVYGGDGAMRPLGDGVEQFFVAYALARYGHEDVILLDGGLQAWTESGGKAVQAFPNKLVGDFQAWLRADLQIEMEELREIKDRGETVLIDTRPKELFEGQAYWQKPGHIPGSINIPWTELVSKENHRLLRPKKELKEIFEKARVGKDKEVLLTCGTGRSASVAFIALTSLLEYPKVRMYEGSFTEWCSHTENTTVKGPQPY